MASRIRCASPPARRGGSPGERQVLQPDVEQELEAGPYLLEHPLGDVALPLVEFEFVEELCRCAQRERGHVVDVCPADSHRQGDRVEPGPLASVARDFAHVLLVVLAGGIALRVRVAATQERKHTLVAGGVLASSAEPVGVGDLDRPVAGPFEHRPPHPKGELAPWLVDVELEGRCDPLEEALEVAALRSRPGIDRTVGDRQVGVGYHQVGVDLELGADAETDLAGAVRAVEGEVPRLQFLERRAVVCAGEMLAEGQGGTVDHLHLGHALGDVERRLQRVGETALDPLTPHQPVDHHLDGVLDIAVELDLLGELVDLAVDARPAEAVPGEICQEGLVFALAPPHHREPGP